jgi:hypothetical protein
VSAWNQNGIFRAYKKLRFKLINSPWWDGKQIIAYFGYMLVYKALCWCCFVCAVAQYAATYAWHGAAIHSVKPQTSGKVLKIKKPPQ